MQRICRGSIVFNFSFPMIFNMIPRYIRGKFSNPTSERIQKSEEKELKVLDVGGARVIGDMAIKDNIKPHNPMTSLRLNF